MQPARAKRSPQEPGVFSKASTTKPKRKRMMDTNISQIDTLDDHQAFTDWAESKGVRIKDVRAQKLPDRGYGLLTTQSIQQGTQILFIPKECFFKPQPTLLKRYGLDRASPQAKLAFSALVEFGSADSTFSIWRKTWPTESDLQASMPIFWNTEAPQYLPTGVLRPLDRQQADFDKDLLACKKALGELALDQSKFRYYWIIVNSRSFYWTASQGAPGSMILCPFADYMNHGPTGSGCTVNMLKSGYEVITQRNYNPGEEIIVSYGAHSNDQLLVHYGFIIDYDPAIPSIDDEIRIDDQVLKLLTEDDQNRLGDLGYLGPFALIPHKIEGGSTAGWTLCFKTQVAVRASFLTCNEWEYFASHGEDLSGDKSNAVIQKLIGSLQDLAGSCKEMVRRISGEAESDRVPPGCMPSSMGTARWQQIHDVVKYFLWHETHS